MKSGKWSTVRKKGISEYLTAEIFDFVAMIDFTKDRYKMVYVQQNQQTFKGGCKTYSVAALKYVTEYVSEDEKDDILRNIGITRIKDILKEKEEYVQLVRLKKESDDFEYKKLIFIKKNTNSNTAFLLQRDVSIENEIENEKYKAMKQMIHTEMNQARWRDEFLQNVSNDMLKPLDAMESLFHVLEGTQNLGDNVYLREACLISRQLSFLINDIQNIGSLENKTLLLGYEMIDRECLKQDLEDLISIYAKRNNISYMVHSCDAGYRYLYTDVTKLKHIINIILESAIKYTRPGGRIVCTYYIKVLEENRERIEFLIEDNGIGLHEEEKTRLFQYYNADSELPRDRMSFEISTAKRILQLMGGDMQLESQIGEGTKVRFWLEADGLEMEISPELSIENTEKFDQEKLREICLGKYVMIVEDSEINRGIMRMYLENLGMLVDEKEDGQEAVDCYMGSKEFYYSMIFMDIGLPYVDGMTATRMIRLSKRGDAKKMPIIALTGHVFSTDIRKIKESGVSYYLPKPYDFEEIGKVISRIFHN